MFFNIDSSHIALSYYIKIYIKEQHFSFYEQWQDKPTGRIRAKRMALKERKKTPPTSHSSAN